MTTVNEVCAALEARRILERQKVDASHRVIPYVEGLLGGELPEDLREFYREHVRAVGEFLAVWPVWNDHVGWRTRASMITALLHAQAVPILEDGCGNLFGLDLSRSNRPSAVYFFDHEYGYARPEYAAGSSLATFLLLMADHDRAIREGWPPKWELAIDPDLARCLRAPAIWDAG